MSIGTDPTSSRFAGFADALEVFEYPLDVAVGVSGADCWAEDFER
jgi:hypothetical protein